MKHSAVCFGGVILPLLLNSCAIGVGDHQRIDLKSDVAYKKTLEMHIDEMEFVGVGVLPRKDSYVIKGKGDTRAELLKIYTCHREHVEEKPGHKFTYKYTPTDYEKSGICPIHLALYDDKGLHSWGVVYSKRGENLKATLSCNGKNYEANGVSICQSRKDLIQTITFDQNVKFKVANPECATPTTKDQKTYTYNTSKGNCLYVFYVNSKQLHRHHTFGYEDYILRKL